MFSNLINNSYYLIAFGVILGAVLTSWIFKFVPESSKKQPPVAKNDSDDYHLTKQDIENISLCDYKDGKFCRHARILEFHARYKQDKQFNKITEFLTSTPSNSIVGIEVSLKITQQKYASNNNVSNYRLIFFDKFNNEKLATIPNCEMELKIGNKNPYFKLEKIGSNFLQDEIEIEIYSKYFRYDNT